MLIAQISDLHVTCDGRHVCGLVPTNTMTERAVASILRLSPRPDLVVISGDLTEHGHPRDYEALAALGAESAAVQARVDEAEEAWLEQATIAEDAGISGW